MPTRSSGSRGLAVIVPLVLAAAARANTYTVGPGTGTDFPDLPTAIAAAQPGDVLLVQPAQYAGGFTLDKGLTIVGYGSVVISGRGVVSHVPAGQRAAIVHATVAGLSVVQCDGPVFLGELTSTDTTSVTTSADVRFTSVTASVPPLPTSTAVSITDARVEIADSSITGSSPGSNHGYGSDDGGIGLDCGARSRVHLTRSDVSGGNGRYNQAKNVFAGDGATGIRTAATSELIIAGVGSSSVSAGFPGLNIAYLDCCFDGDGAPGLYNFSGQVWYSGVSFRPTDELPANPCNCASHDYPPISGTGGTTVVSPEDPALSVAGTFTAGTTSTLTLRGPAGAHAVLALGRRLEVVPDSTTRIETLVVPMRTFDLGVIPASGSVALPVHDPSWAPGTFLAAQGTITLSTGRIRRTNSVPMVFR